MKLKDTTPVRIFILFAHVSESFIACPTSCHKKKTVFALTTKALSKDEIVQYVPQKSYVLWYIPQKSYMWYVPTIPHHLLVETYKKI